jgi:hypothetical protein
VAGRPRRPLWKRRYTSFLHGDKARPDAADELQRLTLFLNGRLLDLAERLTVRSGGGSIQNYCETLLIRALETEQSRHQIEDAETRHGAFEGLRAIADDPEYLAEWTASQARKDGPPELHLDTSPPFALSPEPMMSLPAPGAWPRSADAILRHAGLAGHDPDGFLPCLRRGEIPTAATVEELAALLVDLDRELAGANQIDRRLAHALVRLALESQVLHTDAWPNAFDNWTIDAIRAVQAAVDRILSGESNTY